MRVPRRATRRSRAEARSRSRYRRPVATLAGQFLAGAGGARNRARAAPKTENVLPRPPPCARRARAQRARPEPPPLSARRGCGDEDGWGRAQRLRLLATKTGNCRSNMAAEARAGVRQDGLGAQGVQSGQGGQGAQAKV
jgi:hypothetical protein